MKKTRQDSLNHLPGRARGFCSELQCRQLSVRPHRPCWSDKCLVSGLRRAIGQLYGPEDTPRSCPDYFYDILCTATGLDREFHKLENLLSCSKLPNDSKCDQMELKYSIDDMMYLNLATKYLLNLMNNLKQEFIHQVSVVEGQDCNSIFQTNNIINSLENKLYNLLGKLESFKLKMSNTPSCYGRDRVVLDDRPNPITKFSRSLQERDILCNRSYKNKSTEGCELYCCCDPFVRERFCENRPRHIPKPISEPFISHKKPIDFFGKYPGERSNSKTDNRGFQKHKPCPYLKKEFSNKKTVQMNSKNPPKRSQRDQNKVNTLQTCKEEFDERYCHCPTNPNKYDLHKVKERRTDSEYSDKQHSRGPMILSKDRNITRQQNNIVGNLTAHSDRLFENRNRNKNIRRKRAGKDNRHVRSRTYTPKSRRKKEKSYKKRKRRSNSYNRNKRGSSIKKNYLKGRRNKHKSTSSNESDPTTENTYVQDNMLETYSSGLSTDDGNQSRSSYGNTKAVSKKRSTTPAKGRRNSPRKRKGKSRHRSYSKNSRMIPSGFSVNYSRPYSLSYRNTKQPTRIERSLPLEQSLFTNPIQVDFRADDDDNRNRKYLTKYRYTNTKPNKDINAPRRESITEDFCKQYTVLNNNNINGYRRSIPNDETFFNPPEPCVPSYSMYPQCYERMNPFPCENECAELRDQSPMCPAEIECEPEVEIIPICAPDYRRVSISRGGRRFGIRKSRPRYLTYGRKSVSRKEKRSQSIKSNQRSLSSEEDTRNHKRSYYKHIYYKQKSQPGVHSKYARFGKFLRKSRERVVEYRTNEPDPAEEHIPVPKDTFSRGTSTEVLPSFAKRTSTSDIIKLIKAIGTNTKQPMTREQGVDPIPQQIKTPPIVHELKTKFTNTERINMRTIGTDSIPKERKPAIANMATDPLYYLGQKNKDTNTVPERKKDIKDTGTNPNPIQKVQQTTTATDPLYYLGQRVKHTNTTPVITTHAGTEALPRPVYIAKGTDPLRLETKDKKTSCDNVKTTDRGNDPIYTKMVDKEQQFETVVQKPKMESVYTGTDPYSVSGKLTQTSFVEVLDKKPLVREKEVQTERKPLRFQSRIPEVPPTHNIPVDEPKPTSEEPVSSSIRASSELSMHLVFEKCHEELYRKRGDVCKHRYFTECNNGQNFIICEKKRSNTIRITNRSDCEVSENEQKENPKSTIDMELYFKAKQSPKSVSTRISTNTTAENKTERLSASRSRKTKLSEECEMNVYRKHHQSKQTHVSRKDVYDKSKDAKVKSSTKDESGSNMRMFDWRDVADTIKDDQLSFI